MFWTRIVCRDVGDVVIVDLRGEITLSAESEPATDTIRHLLDQGRSRILLNLAHLPFIDSVGIGDIVRAFTAAKRAGATLKLCGVGPRIRTVLEATRLDKVIEVFDSEDDALASFSAPD